MGHHLSELAHGEQTRLRASTRSRRRGTARSVTSSSRIDLDQAVEATFTPHPSARAVARQSVLLGRSGAARPMSRRRRTSPSPRRRTSRCRQKKPDATDCSLEWELSRPSSCTRRRARSGGDGDVRRRRASSGHDPRAPGRDAGSHEPRARRASREAFERDSATRVRRRPRTSFPRWTSS